MRKAARVIEEAIDARAFPAAVVEVGDATRVLWSQPFGRLTYDAKASETAFDTIFDLASLTKVLATTSIVMQELERGTLDLDDPVARYIPRWLRSDRAAVTLRDLLLHSSGLPAYAPLYLDRHGRGEFEEAICDTALEYEPRTRAVYSDLGFMLLGFVLEDRVFLPLRFDALRQQMGIVEDVQFHPPTLWRHRTAPTENDPWRGHVLVGEVHDENAAALGGAAGHAGLFGTAAAVGQQARHFLQVIAGKTGAFQRATLEMFIAKDRTVAGSSRALGWDTMLPTSSCGRLMSPRSFGHTGFTGTSLWIDPDRGVYVVLLTNRVHPARANEAIRQVRPAFHDAVMSDI